MQITVTQKHIDDGVRSDCVRCPIALALKEVFPSLRLTVGTHSVRRDLDSLPLSHTSQKREVCHLPVVASAFITKFDKTYLLDFTPEPFSFDVPDDLEARYHALDKQA